MSDEKHTEGTPTLVMGQVTDADLDALNDLAYVHSTEMVRDEPVLEIKVMGEDAPFYAERLVESFNSHAALTLALEEARLALRKIADDEYTEADQAVLHEQPTMIWQPIPTPSRRGAPVDETERLNELIARCEKAREPSRELDADIWLACGHDQRRFILWQGVQRKGDPTATVQKFALQQAPKFTASLDAAMTLVPSDCEWEIGSAHLLGVYWARLTSAAEVYTAKRAPTPALALVIAALRARLPHPAKES